MCKLYYNGPVVVWWGYPTSYVGVQRVRDLLIGRGHSKSAAIYQDPALC